MAGNDAGHRRLDVDGGPDPNRDVTAGPKPAAPRRVVDGDRHHPHVEQLARLPNPWKLFLRRPAEASEEDLRERGALELVAAIVDVEHEPPRRGLLVVVVHAGEHRTKPGEIGGTGTSALDLPRQRTHTDPVGGSPATPAVDRAARADRLAIARLEVGTGNLPGQVVAD